MIHRTLVLIMSLATVGACGGTVPGGTDTTGAAPEPSAPVVIDWTAVERALGRSGAMQAGDVYRFGMPRADLNVTVAGVPIRPALALGSWVAFKAHAGGAVAMGDMVLTESELAPVISRLQEGGVEQTAVHHHVTHESPRVLYVHFHAHGDPVQIAETIRDAIALTGTPGPATAASTPPGPFGLDTAAVAAALGYAGRVNGGVYQVGVPRSEAIREGDFEIPPSMGLGTAINFQPTGGGRAAITGDFVLLPGEVNTVIRTLAEHGIALTSLHNHLLNEEPRLFFMHFWANDDALVLARGLRAALEKTNVVRAAVR